MTIDPANLELNASGHTPDPAMERVLRLAESDPAEYRRLSAQIKTQAGVYADLKANHTHAVEAGVVTEEGNPA